MRRQFDQQLALLNRELIEMGALCEDGISAAAEALLKNNPGLAPPWPPRWAPWTRRSTRRSAPSSRCA